MKLKRRRFIKGIIAGAAAWAMRKFPMINSGVQSGDALHSGDDIIAIPGEYFGAQDKSDKYRIFLRDIGRQLVYPPGTIPLRFTNSWHTYPVIDSFGISADSVRAAIVAKVADSCYSGVVDNGDGTYTHSFGLGKAGE